MTATTSIHKTSSNRIYPPHYPSLSMTSLFYIFCKFNSIKIKLVSKVQSAGASGWDFPTSLRHNVQQKVLIKAVESPGLLLELDTATLQDSVYVRCCSLWIFASALRNFLICRLSTGQRAELKVELCGEFNGRLLLHNPVF